MSAALPGTDRSGASASAGGQEKGRMDKVIDAAATGLADGITFMAEHYILFAIFAVLWVAFAIALVMSQGSIDDAWQWIRSLHWLLQGVVWLLFLPVVAGIWVWETTWPLAVRLLLVIGLAGFNLLAFLPKAVTRG